MKKGFFSIFKKEVITIFTTPRLLLLILGVPVLMSFYYASLMDEGVPRDLPVVLLDQDKTKLSRQLGLMLDATPSMKIAFEAADELEGQKSVRRGDVFAMIVIPKDFQKNIQKGIYFNVTCYYNGDYLLPAGLIYKDFQTATGTFAAGARLKTLQQGGLTTPEAMATISPVKTDVHVLFNPYTSYSYYLNLSFMPMTFQIVIMVVSIYAFGSVLKYRQGRELFNQANGSILTAIFAKILPYTLLFLIVGIFMNTLLFYRINIPFKGNFFGLNLFFLSFILICQSMALFLASVMSSLRTALTIGGSYAALAFSFAGYTFPPEGLSTFAQYFSYIFPFTSYMRFTVNYAIRGITFNSEQLHYMIALAVFGCLGVIGILLYNKKLQKGGYDV